VQDVKEHQHPLARFGPGTCPHDPHPFRDLTPITSIQHRKDEIVFAFKVVVEGRLGHPHLSDHPVEPDGVKPVLVEEPVRRLDQSLPRRLGHRTSLPLQKRGVDY
jgi:hypothetical protein